MSGGGSSGSSSRADQESGASAAQKKFKGVRRRKWGKWVSEIRVPGKQERLCVRDDMSPKSVQKAASDAGMAIDAQIIRNRVPENEVRFGTGSGTVNHGLCEVPAGGDHGDDWHGNNIRMREGDISIEDYL
ncbi:hypothetical protein OIU77_004558 [Salix suchowensis]|uniref:AP2/ERF domain-containing protein n=1 Tax=Salix suchowensis TaxID=1278906 RepID=A0ABQ9AWV0_9ROSI|nr:hypothetical protein OIU77_004558 [Salix suchowensis]